MCPGRGEGGLEGEGQAKHRTNLAQGLGVVDFASSLDEAG